jgi:hypothetical protein
MTWCTWPKAPDADELPASGRDAAPAQGVSPAEMWQMAPRIKGNEPWALAPGQTHGGVTVPGAAALVKGRSGSLIGYAHSARV